MNPRRKLSGGGIRRRRERIRTPSCVPTRTATKMHHVHRRGRIMSRDGAWGILLSPADFPAGSPPEESIGETLSEAGPVCQFTGHDAGKTRSLAPRVPPAPTKTGQDRATRKAEQGLRRSIPQAPKSTDQASISKKGADAWGDPARQCPIKEK